MNPQPPPALRLHWSPVSPSWIVSIGLVILAVLPHKIPVFGRQLFGLTIVRILFAGASIYIGMMKPVLGIAMMMLLVSVILMPVSESFTTINLNKDSSGRKHRWIVEDTLAEEPDYIQDRTTESNLNFDKVSEDKPRWGSDRAMDEHPTAIQDKQLPSEYEDDDHR